MRQHFLKRLLVLAPAVWLIASVVFLLGKLMPGTAAEIATQQASENSAASVKAEIRAKILQTLRHRTGQDLPLFYFNLGTAAEPDTFYRIYPETDRIALQKLVYKHGNWPVIASFYQNLQTFLQNKDLASGIKTEAAQLLNSGSEMQTRQVFQRLKSAHKVDLAYQNSIQKLQKSRAEVLAAKPGIKNYLPALKWYGFENQYHRWFGQLLRGNLGFSTRDGRPVAGMLFEAFALTFKIAFITFIITALLSLEIAMLLCRKSAGRFQGLSLGFLYSLESLPLYIIALLVLAFSSSMLEIDEDFNLVLPVFCLVLANLPFLIAQAYASLQQVIGQPFILSAKAKGLSEVQLLRRQVLRPAILPVITLLSDFFPALLAGSVILEVVFSLPGMGSLLVHAVLARDYAVLAGIVLLTGFIKILSHLAADILLVLADPRLRVKTA